MPSKFNKDYFENGIATNSSCYENYRWIPELTYPMAFSVAQYLKLSTSSRVLEYGCAHGFLVKALNDFQILTYGIDISEYAIENCPPSIRGKVSIIHDSNIEKTLSRMRVNLPFDVVIAKDVFEHIPAEDLNITLSELSRITKKLFIIVPLGDMGKYRIKAYHLDPTHVIAENEQWWQEKIEINGFKIQESVYQISGIKDKWQDAHKKGNGFFLAESIWERKIGK